MIASVIVDISNSAVDRIFEYIAIPDLEVGDRVLVPFGPRVIEGYVVDLKETAEYDIAKLKPIQSVIDEFPAITTEMIALMRYLHDKYKLRIVDILRLFIPAQMRQGRVKALQVGYASLRLDVTEEEIRSKVRKSAAAQIELIEHLRAHESSRVSELNKIFSAAALRSLVSKEIAVITSKRVLRTPYARLKEQEASFKQLKQSQIQAYESIMSGGCTTHLLHGVTGSGKTEVYINCILKVLEQDKQAIMLVPEISLTPQMLRVFRERFGEKVALLHSGLSAGERFDEWSRLRTGDASIAIGARSAIFAPLCNLGIIIIDEEHDSSYISETNPRYFTQEIAEFRKNYNTCPLVLGSATPSIESYYKASIGKFHLIEMPDRVNEKKMPELRVVDMCREIRLGNKSFLSVELQEQIQKCLDRGHQAILFLNRRGYASYQQCRACGYVVKCKDCDVSMVYHYDEDRLKCHYCNARQETLDVCPECGSNSIKQGAMGTERVALELNRMFPGVRVVRMDNDTTQKKDAHIEILGRFAQREADILVGTQMVAKGHDFPNVTLVGILEADMSLYISDFRSVERTYQLITQVAGRAGRANLDGLVILQTYSPRHYAFKFSRTNDYKGFFDKEVNIREVTKFPPFSRILRIIVSGEDDALAVDTLRKINDDIKRIQQLYQDAFIYFKAMRSPVKRIQNKSRVQIIMRLRGEKTDEITTKICEITESHRHKDLLSFVEFDPQNLR